MSASPADAGSDLPVHDSSAPASGSARIRRPAVLALAFAALLLGLGIVVGLPHLDRPAFLPSPELPWWILAVAFAVTEVYVVHLQVRRQGSTISLSEIPSSSDSSSPHRSHWSRAGSSGGWPRW